MCLRKFHKMHRKTENYVIEAKRNAMRCKLFPKNTKETQRKRGKSAKQTGIVSALISCNVPKDWVWSNDLQPMLLQTFSHVRWESVCVWFAMPLVSAAKNAKSHNKNVRLLCTLDLFTRLKTQFKCLKLDSDQRSTIISAIASTKKFKRMRTLYFYCVECFVCASWSFSLWMRYCDIFNLAFQHQQNQCPSHRETRTDYSTTAIILCMTAARY